MHDIIYDFQPMEAETVLAAWLRSAFPDPARGYTREDFAAHIRNEHSTFRWLLESIRVSSGFEVERADFSGLISTARIHASSAETLT